MIDTHSKKFPTYEDREISPDLTIYEQKTVFTSSKTQSTNRAIEDVAFMAEFKHDPNDDPFRDNSPGFEYDSDRSEKTLGQICSYATAHMAAQFRSYVFSLLVFPNYTRILRWDRAGVIVTAQIDLTDCAFLLANFFWRYEHMTNSQRGYDDHITAVTLQDVERVIPNAIKKLDANEDSRFFSVTIPHDHSKDDSEFIITKPTYMGIGSPTGRSTRTFQALSVTTKERVFLKDTWRVIHPGVLPEHDIYRLLALKQVPHVATMITYHDMLSEATKTKEFADAEWLKNKDGDPPRSFRKFQHYRLVLKEVGHPLESFRNVKELIQVFRDALQGTFSHYPAFISLANGWIAHRLALDMAKVLHRDISTGNIMITEEGRGLLVDWDLSKYQALAMSGALSPPERTVRVVETYLDHQLKLTLCMIGHLAIHGCSAHDTE